MLTTVRATIKNGKIEILEPIPLLEGSQVLVTLLENTDFWLNVSEESIKGIWDNPEDDIYAELLKK
jgi:hypothetical protein